MARKKSKHSRAQQPENRHLLSHWDKAGGKRRDNLWRRENSKPGPVRTISPDELDQGKGD